MKFPWTKTQFADAPKDGKKATTAQLITDTAIEKMVQSLGQIPDPDQALEQAGMTRADLRRLEYDDEISTAMETRLSAVHGIPWRLEPGEGDRVDFIWQELRPIMEPLINAAWKATPYGYSVIEVIYARREGGRIGIERVEERPFEWFEPRRDGRLRYYPASGSEAVDVDTKIKFLLTRRRPTYDNPFGEAMLSRLFAAFFLRQAGWKFWPQFLERFGAPLLIGKTAGNTTEMATMLAQAVQSAVAAVDKDDEVTAITPGDNGQAFERFEVAVTKRIQKVILGQTLTSDVTDRGSYAAAKVHDGVRSDRMISDVRMIAGTAQHLVNALMMLNWPGEAPPEFVMEDSRGLQLERAERDKHLAEAGILKFKREYLMRAYEFEEDDFEIPETKGAEGAGSAQASVRAALQAFQLQAGTSAQGERFTPGQQALEDLADATLEQAGQPIPPRQILAAIKASKTPEELAEALAEVYEGNDPQRFREVLERALFAADVMGYVHTENQQV